LDKFLKLPNKTILVAAEVVHYTKQAGYPLEMQNQCAEIKIRAERKAGELIPDQITKGGNPKLHDVTLKNLDISQIQSHRWQNIASIPEDKFEEHIDEIVEAKEELTTADFLIL
jgi:hypothetical protein